MSRFDSKVAPPDLIREDYEQMTRSMILRANRTVEQLSLFYTIASHAQSGHRTFGGVMYPNTTFHDVARAMRLSSSELYQEQQNLLDEVKRYARRVMKGETLDRAVNEQDEPLFGFAPFRFLTLEPKGVLQGLFLGGLRDSAEVRDIADDRFGGNIGSGRMYYVNRRIMNELGIDGSQLATQEWGARISELREKGMICDHADPDAGNKTPLFIRHRRGTGASDDAAIVCAGKLWGISAAAGCFLADVMDTFEKGLPQYGDQDYDLALEIERDYASLGMTREDAYQLTYLSAVVPEHDERAVDSSLRFFLMVDRRFDLCAIESHLLYVENRRCPELLLDKARIPSHRFYQYIEERLANLPNAKSEP